MLKKKYLITAFLAFCLTVTLFIGVTTSGNQKGLTNITNYSTRSSSVVEKTFPEILVLRGAIVKTSYPPYYKTLLLDSNMPFPIVNDFFKTSRGADGWGTLYDQRFVYEVYPQQPYKIHGEVTISLYLRFDWATRTGAYRGVLYFEKMLSNGTVIVLASADITQTLASGMHDHLGGLTSHFDTPITINKNERISVRVYVEDSGRGVDFWHFCRAPPSNDFMIIIPMIEYEYLGPVGGLWIPVDKFSLLAPYIALVSTIILAISASVAYIKYKKKQ